MKLKYFALSGMAVCLLLASCNKKDEAAVTTDEAPEVKLAQVVSQEIGQSETYSATVESDIKNNIAPNAPMRIKSILVEVGDHVAKGQVVAYLDATSENQVDYQMASQLAAISGQQAAVSGTQASVRSQQANVRGQEASIKSTEAQIKHTEAEVARYATLLQKGGMSQSDYEAAELQLNTLKQGLQAQREQLAGLRSAVEAQQAQVTATQAQIAASESQYKALEVQRAQLRENNKLVSPVSGVVTARNYDNGDMYAGQPVVVVEQTNSVKLKINASEMYYSKMKVGMPVSVTLDAYPGETFNGTVSIVTPIIDATTHTFPVEITVSNEEQKVRPGMFARATVNYDYQNHVVIPDEALVKQMGAGDRYVYVYNPSTKTVSYNKVVLGKHMGNKYEIISGVNAYDQVVIAGQSRLANGKKVKVVK